MGKGTQAMTQEPDIVERLRISRMPEDGQLWAERREAAAEIERLQTAIHEGAEANVGTQDLMLAEIERLRAHNKILCDDQHDYVRYCTRIHEQEAEIERLRATIVRAKDALRDGQSTQWVHYLLVAALAPKP
jgi:hypothetical protein